MRVGGERLCGAGGRREGGCGAVIRGPGNARAKEIDPHELRQPDAAASVDELDVQAVEVAPDAVWLSRKARKGPQMISLAAWRAAREPTRA